MSVVLAGDIGGTKTILRLVGATVRGNVPELHLLHEDTYPSQNYPDLVPIVREFLSGVPEGETAQLDRACFGIAGPVVDNASTLTNLAWSLDGTRLAKDLNLDRVTLVNDFAAVGYGVLGLHAKDLHTLQAAEPQLDAPIAVLGAGTGLGECFLLENGDRTYVGATEGGHTDFAPRSHIEFELLDYIKASKGIPRVSVERVVSGQGILSIYEFLCDRYFSDRPDSRKRLEDKIPTASIANAALEETDEIARKTMELFVSAYGAEAGNLALKLLPYRGLYVAGGIAAKILPLLHRNDGFLTAFRDKGRVSNVLDRVPIHIVLEPKVGLIGAAICAARG
ncbi:MAG: glucokinase [Cyanobacteria bacterium SID2]|nr:glucokinase [Cyanobacteria bacterium SID2]